LIHAGFIAAAIVINLAWFVSWAIAAATYDGPGKTFIFLVMASSLPIATFVFLFSAIGGCIY